MKRPANTTILLAVVSVLLGLNLLAVHEPKAHALQPTLLPLTKSRPDIPADFRTASSAIRRSAPHRLTGTARSASPLLLRPVR